MKKEKLASFGDLLDLAETGQREIMVALRATIMDVDANACEVVRLGDRAATYGVGPKKMSEGYCYIMPQKSWVNLGFYRGAHLTDMHSLMEGTGKNMRHVKIRSMEDAGRGEIRALILKALEERQRRCQ